MRADATERRRGGARNGLTPGTAFLADIHSSSTTARWVPSPLGLTHARWRSSVPADAGRGDAVAGIPARVIGSPGFTPRPVLL
jgi:hypothetical protein